MSRLAKLTQKVKPGKKAKSKKSSDTGKLLKVEDYKGYQMHINEIVNNPNGQKSQTVLIYKDEKPVGGAFADLQFENAIEKAKSKIDNYFAKGGETGFFTKEGVLDKEYYNTFTLAGNGKRKYNIFQSHNDRQLREAAKKLFPGMAYTEHLSRAKYMKEKAQEFMDKYIKSVEDNFKKEFGRPVEPTDYKVSGIWTNDFSESAKKEITENLSKYNDYKSALNFHNAVLNKKDKQEYTYAKGGRTHAAIAADKDRKAMHPGRRVSASGNVYHENRANRSDTDRRKKFEEGGKVVGGYTLYRFVNSANKGKSLQDFLTQYQDGLSKSVHKGYLVVVIGKDGFYHMRFKTSSPDKWKHKKDVIAYVPYPDNKKENIVIVNSNKIFEEGGEVADDLLEFTIPDWALSALINADESGLTDEEQEKLNEFVEETVEEYGNANFMLPEEEKADLGFRWRNDIDGALGGNCHLLYLRPSKEYAKGGTTQDDRVEEILRHYVTAALWSSSDMDKEDEMLDANYSFEDVSPELLDRFRADIRKFITENDADIKEVGLTDDQVGHSLWLSQNRHGAGFFDYSGEEADRLQKEAIKLGSHDLYAGNDGKIYSLNSGINKSQYAKGGKTINLDKIKNQYNGWGAKDVWQAWDYDQRQHFIQDHFAHMQHISHDMISADYDDLPKMFTDILQDHVSGGQYAKGGSTVSVSSIIEKYKGKINSRADIKAFFADLYKMDIAFHPDDDFADIVNLESDKHVFSKKEAADLNKIMQECFAWSENNNEDLYEIGISVQVPEFVKRGILPEESMYQLVRLSVDGSETTLAEFIEQNEEMDTKEIDMIKNLKPGESYFTGHAGSTEIKRLEDAYAKGGMTDDDKEDYLNNFFEENFTYEQLMDKFDYLTSENRDNRITADELENYVNNNLVGTMLNKHAPIEYVESLKDLSIYAKGGKTPGRRKVVRQIFEEEEFDYSNGGKAGAITAADEGNWVDGNRGIYQGEQIINIAERYGFVVKEEDEANKKSDGEFYYELVDEAIEYLNELAPEGYYFGNTESGDFGLWKTEDEEFSKGGEVKWQDAQIGDNARVIAENKTGLIIQAYGRKFHLKFVDGKEKTYDDTELEFIRNDEFARGGVTKKELKGYDMESISDYWDYIIESRINGVYSQVRSLYEKMNSSQKKEFHQYVKSADPETYNYIVDTYLSRGGRTRAAIAADKDRKAMHPGRRVSADGSVYYENRANRSDADRRRKFAAGGSTGDLKTLHNGRYLTFATQGGKLHIFLTDEGREWIKENGPITYQNFWELFDDITGNSELLYFNDIGDAGFGLTSAPGFTDGYFYNDKGELEEHESGGNVWWFEPYQVIDPWKELTEKGEVDFDGTEGNKLENGGQLEVTPKDEFARGGRTHAAIAADKDRKAMHPGRRVSSDGKVYYENRPNRSDADRRRKFAAGGDTNSDTVLIYSSHGEIMADKKTGLVKEVVRYEGSELPENITKIDLEEYKKYHKVDLIPDSIDILDVGFWYDENKYEEPEQDWREREFARGGRTRAAIVADKDRKAMHPGRRVSASGNVYHENRANRSDADRRRKFAAGGQIGSGKNGYIAFYKGKQVEVLADTSYQAQETAAKHFKARKSYEVTVVLAEKDGKQVSHVPDFAKGGQAVSKDVLLPNDDNPEGFANGGDVDSDMILLEAVDKMVTEDNYDEGENPDTTRNVFYESEMKEFKNYSELFDYLNRNYGLSSDPKHYLAFEDGRLTYNQTEDAEGSKASEGEMERFKKGLINLYNGDYNIYVSRIKKSTITTDEMAKWGAEKYEKGGQAYANGGTTGKPEMIIRHKENGKFDVFNPDGSMFKEDVSSVIAARQHAIDAGFGFREEKNTRKEGIYSIQKAAHDGQDITEMVKAYGPSFVPDLLSSIEEQYASGHSMRYSILRDVVKNIRFDASDNRIPNTEAQPYVENMIPFKGNNLEGKRTDNGDYVVLSFGHYPIWYYNARAKKWYGNADKYSQVTAMHISQTRPNWEAEILAHPDLLKQMRTDETKFECGGMLQNLFEVPYPNISVASSGLQGVTTNNPHLT